MCHDEQTRDIEVRGSHLAHLDSYVASDGPSRMSSRWLILLSALLVIVAVALINPAPASASDAPSVDKRTVRVGFFQFDGYHIQSDDGTLSGYGYDVVQYLARYNDWDVEFVGYDKSWAEMQQMLQDGEIDLLTSAQKTPAREAVFAFSAEDIGTSSTMLTVKADDVRYVAGDYPTYAGMRVGMLENSTRNEGFAQFAAEKGFTYTPVYFDSTTALKAALQDGTTIDAVLTSSLRNTDNEWVMDQFDPSPFYVITRKDDTELMQEVDDALANLDSDIPGWRSELANEYYAVDDNSKLALNASEREYIDSISSAGTVFKVAVNPDAAPYSYRDASGAPVGLFPMLFDKIAANTGISYEFIDTPTRADYDAVVNSGEADIVIDAPDYSYLAWSNGYKLTDSYLTVTVSRLTLKDGPEDITSVCMPEDIAMDIDSHGRVISDENMEFTTLGTTQECVDAVLDGSYDAAYLYTDTALQYVNGDARNRMSSLIVQDYSQEISIAVANRLDARLLPILDKGGHSVESAADEALLAQANAANTRKSTFASRFYDNPLPFVSAILAIITLGIIIVFRSRAASRERARRVELEQKDAELSSALTLAEKASAAQQVFLSSMSHDMRTPLNGIVGFTELALETDDPGKRSEYLQKIDLSCHLMLDLINDVLDMSKIESGKMEIRPESFDTQGLIDAIVESVQLAASEQGVDFRVSLDEDYPRFICADRLRLQQVVLNLLTNAIKFTPEGGKISLLIHRLPEEADGYNTLIQVADDGIGMSEEFQNRMFEPFAQEHQSAVYGLTGTGLGLAIVKRIVDLMDGHIEVVSELMVGTTFSVYLSLKAVDIAREPLGGKAKHPAAVPGMRVLLCEDNDLNAEIAEAILRERGGAEVERARNGQEGVDIFEASEEGHFDVILMDVRMPVRNGIEATRAIRALDRTDAREIPIIAMSADAFAEDVSNCLEAGMNAHVAKPVDPVRLLSVLHDAWNEAD